MTKRRRHLCRKKVVDVIVVVVADDVVVVVVVVVVIDAHFVFHSPAVPAHFLMDACNTRKPIRALRHLELLPM